MRTNDSTPSTSRWRSIGALILVIASAGASGESNEGGRTVPPSTQPNAVASQPTTQPENGRPVVHEEDLRIIVDYARRSFRAKVLGRPEQAPKYRPMSLADMRGIVHLTLRKSGGARVEAESDEMPIIDAAVAAGTLLGQAAMDAKLELERGGDDHGLELEWLGPVDYLKIPYFENGETWTDALVHSFEPGVEGIGVEFRGNRGWTRPSQIFIKGYTADLAIAAAEKQIELRGIHKVRFPEQIKYYRFWSYLVWQADARSRPIVLHRGDTLVSPDAVTESGLKSAIDRIGTYLLYRQNKNGEFSHEFVAYSGLYGKGNSARVQLRALEGVASLHKARNDAESAKGLRRGIEALKPHLEPLVILDRKADGTEYEKEVGLALAPVGHTGVLELTARLLSAIQWLSAGSDFEKEKAGLINGLITSQADTGFIAMTIGEGEQQGEIKLNDADCCRAILSLCRVHADQRDARISEAVSKAVRYYHERAVSTIDPRAAAALIRALCLHYAESNDARVSDKAFELADRLASVQLNERNTPFPELWGAINVSRAGEVGADTAIYLSALADALRLAERIGDRPRIRTYRDAVILAARFILQLEVRETGCFFIRNPGDALGGIRNELWSSRLRVDWTGLGLESLIDARAALFGGRQ